MAVLVDELLEHLKGSKDMFTACTGPIRTTTSNEACRCSSHLLENIGNTLIVLWHFLGHGRNGCGLRQTADLPGLGAGNLRQTAHLLVLVLKS